MPSGSSLLETPDRTFHELSPQMYRNLDPYLKGNEGLLSDLAGLAFLRKQITQHMPGLSQVVVQY